MGHWRRRSCKTRLLDLLARPEELKALAPEQVPELLGELETWKQRLRLFLESQHNGCGNGIKLLTPEEAATILRVKPHFVYEQARAGRLKSVSLGRYVRFRLNDVEAFIEENSDGQDS